MQELSLFAPVTYSRVPQLLRILSAYTQMKPQQTLTHHLVYKPKRPRPPVGTVSNQQEMYHLQLVSTIDLAAHKNNTSSSMTAPAGSLPGEIEMGGTGEVKEEVESYVNRQKWSIKFTDIPEGSRRTVTSRSVMEAAVKEGNVLRFMDSLGYVYVSSYLSYGHYLIHNDLTLTLTEILLPPLGTSPDNCDPFPLQKLTRLDPNGTFMLQATVNVLKNSDVESLSAGSKTLEDFARRFKGIVELEAGDRLALDTRAK